MTAHSFDAVRLSPFYTPEHEAFRQTLRRFVAREIEPYANQWDEAGEFPRELYKKAAAIGYMQLGYPEALRRHRMRPLHADHRDAGDRARRLRRGRRRASSATRSARRRSSIAARRSMKARVLPQILVRREDLGARHHRAERRLRRREPAHDRAA